VCIMHVCKGKGLRAIYKRARVSRYLSRYYVKKGGSWKPVVTASRGQGPS
jgi:hypothetical protein